MRKFIVPAVIILAIGGSATQILARLANAQARPSPIRIIERPHEGQTWGQGWMRSKDHEWAALAQWRNAPTWSLFAQTDDKQLTVSDVQKIAEALLLWHGNHTWKVINVAANPNDNSVNFAFGAADGTLIAQFAMNTKTGRLHRIG
ncbi:MAG: hypothetical protein JOY71_16055 [Acetobacteraceae bacterium]|nr:hypothetical protein [Acetobacteraceae bacterium]MBV8523611.1 hypothetical protein [Acetobacteraceae bacterium]